MRKAFEAAGASGPMQRSTYVPTPTWPRERIRRLIELYREHVSFTQIARELGTTRAAIAGKLSGLGALGKRPPKPEPEPDPPKIKKKPPAGNVKRKPRSHHRNGGTTDPKRYPSKWRRPGPRPILTEIEISPIAQRRPLHELTDDFCHWPIGDPSSRDFSYCGGWAVTLDPPYCFHHAIIAHRRKGRSKRKESSICHASAKIRKPSRLAITAGLVTVTTD